MGKLRRSEEASWKISTFRRLLINLRIIPRENYFRWSTMDPFYARMEEIEQLFRDWFRGKKDKKRAAFQVISDQKLWWWCYRDFDKFD